VIRTGFVFLTKAEASFTTCLKQGVYSRGSLCDARAGSLWSISNHWFRRSQHPVFFWRPVSFRRAKAANCMLEWKLQAANLNIFPCMDIETC